MIAFSRTRSTGLKALKNLKQRFKKREINDTELDKTLKLALYVNSRKAKINGIRGFGNPEMYSMWVNRQALAELVENADIDIYQNRSNKLMLDSTVPVIFPDQDSSAFIGNGQTVVVLDTGVETGHSFLSGKVISAASACFSSDNGSTHTSLCDDVATTEVETEAFGGSSGDNCPSSLDGCNHGTAMAGIIAGANVGSTGVATSSSIISIKVATQLNDSGQCGGVASCVTIFDSDVIRALEYVNSITGSDSIAAVNFGFGSTATYLGTGDCEAAMAATYNTAVADLYSSNIALVAPSGNDGSNNSMSIPSCHSQVFAIAASDTDIAIEAPLASSNINADLSYFAPGASVTTSVLNNMFAAGGGTSAASAHFAGAWAVLKSKNSTASIGIISNAFSATGVSLTRNLVTKKRINITDALAALAEPIVGNSLCVPIKASNGKVVLICL